jgi:hypothetical protein
MLGPAEIERQFGRKLSDRFNIHRTRKGFANQGRTDFSAMATDAVRVTDKVVVQLMKGQISERGRCWLIPLAPR